MQKGKKREEIWQNEMLARCMHAKSAGKVRKEKRRRRKEKKITNPKVLVGTHSESEEEEEKISGKSLQRRQNTL